MTRYRTIVADPPWRMGDNVVGWQDGRVALPYEPMAIGDVCALPVSSWAAPSAHLYLWVPTAFLFEAPKVVEAWGFRRKNVLVWCKPLGVGRRFRQSCEYVLFCERGGSLPVTRKDVSTWHRWPRGRHSAKPDAFYDLAESVSPGPYLDMFSRRARMGWDAWGHEALDPVDLDGSAV